MKIFGRLTSGRFAHLDSTIAGFGSLFFARLPQRAAGIVLLIGCFVFFEFLFPNFSFAFGNSNQSFVLSAPSSPTTESFFKEKTSYQTTTIAFDQKKVVDPTLAPGQEKIQVAGSPGKKVTQVNTLYYKNQIYSQETIVVENIKPVAAVVSVGPTENSVATPFGNLSYSQKLSLWATAYDSTCHGCTQTTSIGLKTGFGVVAVDPRVIPLKSRLYIPGYGLAVAGDTGGAIKGNRIDLGFASVAQSGWYAHYTDVYILN